MSLFPPVFEYEPVPPFHATSIEYGIPGRSSVHWDLRQAVIDAWTGDHLFCAVIDGAGYTIGCYRDGFLAGVSAVFEVISNLTVEQQNADVYKAMLQVEMTCRLNWQRL